MSTAVDGDRREDAGAVPDLVNAALLGTDRRPVPAPDDADPATWLLEAAGGRRARTLVAAGTADVASPAPGPEPVRPRPSAAARAVLDELLATGSAPLLDLWLREALDAGTGLAPEHWSPVLDRARRATELDRGRLGAALGPDGLWFARHNPAWAALVRAAEGAGDQPVDTLTDDATRRALDSLADRALAPAAARALGRSVGTRLPLTAYGSVTEAGLAAELPAARAGFSAAEEVLWVRWDLAHAFDPGREPPGRRSVAPAPDHRPPVLQERR